MGKIRFGLILLLSLILFSCVKESGTDEVKQEGSMTLNISCSDITRATEPGSDAFNENLLDTLDIFFYRASGDADCFEHDRVIETYHGSATYTKKLETLTKEKFFGTGETGSCYVYVIANGPKDDIQSLLDESRASVANLRKIVLFSPDLGNSEVKSDMGTKLVRQRNFVMDGGATMNYSNGSASVNVKLARSLSKIQLYVHFPDSVIVNGKTYKPSIISVNGIDDPDIRAWGKAVFSNGLMRGYINDSTAIYNPSDEDYYPASGLSYDDKARYIRKDTLSITRQSNGLSYYTHSPFYTYPMTWETFKDNVETRPTTLMLVVDWYSHESTGMTSKTTFYTVDVNMTQVDGEVYKFKRNTFYKLYVDVNTIGSGTSTNPVEIEGECEILDWNHVNQETSVENLRYLTVEQNEYTLDNENTIYIPYSTSHNCEIVNVSVWAYNLKTNKVKVDSLVKTTSALTAPSSADSTMYIPDGYDQLGKYVVDTILSTEHLRPYSFKLTNKYIIVQHKLDNREDVNDDIFDYVPFHITFTVRHIDRPEYSETISITQHPEISVDPQKNSDFDDDSDDNKYSGYVYVNGYNLILGEGSATGGGSTQYLTRWTYIGSNYNGYGGARGLSYASSSTTPSIIADVKLTDVIGISGEAQNKNPYRYLIRTAVANGDTQYIIGDPRTYKPDSLLYNNGEWSKYAIGMDSDGNILSTPRRLQNYYRSRRSGEMPNAQYVMSPRFIVASSYGVTRSITRENAERRCASYQEEGYPAGRWRVPTTAEVSFCVQLTKNGMIPRLFGTEAGSSYDNCYYYTSTGYIYQRWLSGVEQISFEENADPDGDDYYAPMWVRCVYDAWYWGQEPVLSKNSSFSAGGQTVTGYRFTWGDIAR